MYKKHGRHDIDVESVNNDDQFATQFFNFMRKDPYIVITQVYVPQSIWISALLRRLRQLRAVPAPLSITKSTLWMTSMNLPLAHYSMSKAGC
jgi:hypothetical protein